MPKGQHHLTYGERCQIHALRKSGLSGSAVARQLGRDRSTVWRGLQRNTGGNGYRHGQAQDRAAERRRRASSAAGKMTPERWRMVEERLAEGWSPERTAGRLRRDGVPMAGRQWIYEHIRADRRKGGELYLLLRRRGKKPNWRGGCHSGRGHIPGRVDIAGRPEVVDAIIGRAHSGAVVSLVERATEMTFLQRVDRRTAGGGRRHARPAAAEGHPRPHDHVGQWQGIRGPCCGCGATLRGVLFREAPPLLGARADGHVNGLVRQYLPKVTDLRKVTDAQVKAVQDRLNTRPRKALGYLTPAEAFARARPL